MVEETDVCRGWTKLKARLGDSARASAPRSARADRRRTRATRAALDPPAVLPLIVEQRAAPAAHVVFELYLRVLLHIHLDCVRRRSGSLKKRVFLGLFWLEIERNAVHTVPQPGRPGAVLEDVAEVPLAPRAVHLGPLHPVASGRWSSRPRPVHRRPEARPSGSAVELCLRREELLAAAGAPEDALAVFLVQRTRARALGAVLAQHLKLLRASACRAIPRRSLECPSRQSTRFDRLRRIETRPRRTRPVRSCSSESCGPSSGG